MFVFGRKSLENREGVDQRLIEIDDLALEISTIDFGHPRFSGLRTLQDQQALFESGNSKCDGIDKKSKHQSGRALDFYAFVEGEATWEKTYMAMIGAAYLQSACMLGYKISWGGFWQDSPGQMFGWDMGHVELDD